MLSDLSAQRTSARKQLESALKRVLSNYDLELKQCGNKFRTLSRPLDEATGYWQNPSDSNKPLRWILHLHLDGGDLTASVPTAPGSRRIAYANTTKGKTGAITLRVLPAFALRSGGFVFHEDWEWLLLFCFLPGLPAGTSGQLFEDFNEKTGSLSYKGQSRDYIASALITLSDAQDTFELPDGSGATTYGEATAAVSSLIRVCPMEDVSTPESDEG